MRGIGRSVRKKLQWVVMATTGLALLITGASLAWYDQRTFRARLVDDLAAIADILALAAQPALQFRDPDSAREYLGLLQAKPIVTGAAIYASNGQLFADYSPPGSSATFPKLPDTADGYRVESGELVLTRRIVSNGEILGTVHVEARYELMARLGAYLAILAAVTLLSLGAAALISYRLHRGITAPIAAVTAVARGVLDKRDYSLRAPKTTNDEIGVLVEAFNDMLDELGQRAESIEASNQRLEAEVAERGRAESARALSEQRNRMLVSAMAQVVWTADAYGRFVEEQPSWSAYTGQTRREYQDFGWRSALDPTHRDALDTAWLANREPPLAFEIELAISHAESGRRRLATFRAVPIVDQSGRAVDWVGAVTDIDDQRRTQEELRHLNIELEQRVDARTAQLEAANRELESFSYSVSHDLRAPLRAVDGFASLLWADHQDQLDPEAQRKLGIIRSEAERMGMLIDDLLAFSRLGRKSLQPTDLDMGELAASVVARLVREPGNERADVRIGRLPPARADRALLEQVWVNLLANAFKFSSKEAEPVIEVGAIAEQDELVYFVRDNGAGFDPRYSSKLFGVFQRLHDSSEFPGTGVGLALVQRIVVRHGGRVWADGKPGDGATFHFTLPKQEDDSDGRV